jgi:hypothetical protein
MINHSHIFEVHIRTLANNFGSRHTHGREPQTLVVCASTTLLSSQPVNISFPWQDVPGRLLIQPKRHPFAVTSSSTRFHHPLDSLVPRMRIWPAVDLVC